MVRGGPVQALPRVPSFWALNSFRLVKAFLVGDEEFGPAWADAIRK